MTGDGVGAALGAPNGPGAPLGAIPRPRLAARLDGPARVVLIVAPPGYGKTEVARQWMLTARDAAWLAVDLLDAAAGSFWSHLLRSLRTVAPAVDDEPELLLHERGPADPLFLEALVSQLERAATPASIVIDDIGRVTDESVFDGLALLVNRIGHLVRFVIIGRADPPLPTAPWRSRGWLTEIREEDLRFADDEAALVAAHVGGLELTPEAIAALNASAEGWPIALHLALMAVASEPEPESRAHALARADRLLIDYLVSEVLDHLPPAQRNVLLALSVLPWFDRELCAGLLGDDALPAVAELRRQHLFLTTLGAAGGAMRFHPLFRTLLESELQWRDPARHHELHRRAAELWTARGDRAAAYAHLVTIGDTAGATRAVVPLALELVDRGDVTELQRHMRSLPSSISADAPEQAFDLAVGWLFAGSEAEAVRWCTAGEELLEGARSPRAEATWAVIALMQGAIDRAREHVDAFRHLVDEPSPGGPIERRFATVAARVALLDERLDDATDWVRAAQSLRHPPVVADVLVPMLMAWLELEAGELVRARELGWRAVTAADRFGARPHFGTLDALIVTARSCLALGALRQADDIMERARAEAPLLGWTLPVVRTGLLSAELSRLRRDPQGALEVLDGLRAVIGVHSTRHLEQWLAAAETAALIDAGQYRTARTTLERVPDGPRTRLLAARLTLASRSDEPIESLLAERAGWTVPERLEAALILAARAPTDDSDAELAAALALGRERGWVSPFLGLGAAADAALARQPLAHVHPALAAAARPAGTGARVTVPPRLVETLTPREQSLLELLPTHLSYARLGDELFLSVNTIKSNLKSIYRKLGVASRAEAVDVATDLGLLGDAVGSGATTARTGTPLR